MYVASIGNMNETDYAGVACADFEGEVDKESRDGHEHIPHCHELDAPYDTVSAIPLKHSPLVSSLIYSYKATSLSGYSPPIKIPPKN